MVRAREMKEEGLLYCDKLDTSTQYKLKNVKQKASLHQEKKKRQETSQIDRQTDRQIDREKIGVGENMISDNLTIISVDYKKSLRTIS